LRVKKRSLALITNNQQKKTSSNPSKMKIIAAVD